MGAGAILSHVPEPIRRPFGSAELVETKRLEAIPVGEPVAEPPAAGFLDGIQRYSLAGRLGLNPVVRAHVAAAVLARSDGELRVASEDDEQFVAVPLDRLSERQRQRLAEVGMPIHDCGADARAHPFLDLQRAAELVQQRRELLEVRVAREYARSSHAGWLVVDGSIMGHDLDCRILGVIKSHETQFFEGEELETALTLAPGCRTSVFARIVQGRGRVHSWYLRLWPWEEHDLLYGLLRIECMCREPVQEATEVSRWLLAERAPLSAPDGRWDRLIYPIRQVEEYLRARTGGWI
ncbi:MAG: hypothetical protein ACE5HT_01090 [Gemmatimonadales bacterium]